jgi:hypothetical protein
MGGLRVHGLVTTSKRGQDRDEASGEPGQTVRIECTDCHFSAVVSDDDEEAPADVLVDHGREHGHTLDVSPVED